MKITLQTSIEDTLHHHREPHDDQQQHNSWEKRNPGHVVIITCKINKPFFGFPKAGQIPNKSLFRKVRQNWNVTQLTPAWSFSSSIRAQSIAFRITTTAPPPSPTVLLIKTHRRTTAHDVTRGVCYRRQRKRFRYWKSQTPSSLIWENGYYWRSIEWALKWINNLLTSGESQATFRQQREAFYLQRTHVVAVPSSSRTDQPCALMTHTCSSFPTSAFLSCFLSSFLTFLFPFSFVHSSFIFLHLPQTIFCATHPSFPPSLSESKCKTRLSKFSKFSLSWILTASITQFSSRFVESFGFYFV